MRKRAADLIHDWNAPGGRTRSRGREITFDDETLRDGLQSCSVLDPPISRKLELIHLMAAVGIGSADIGMPGASERAAADCAALAREIVDARLAVAPNCAARTVERDVLAVLEVAQRAGIRVEVALFVGSSPLRRHVEGWTTATIGRWATRATALAVRHGAPVTFVAEDSTRSQPDDLRRLLLAAVHAGASRVCLADTAGHATPLGAVRLVRFVRRLLRDAGAPEVGLDWHGHNDRGLAVANAMAAARAGADRLHATALGVGERVGNPPMEQLLVNAALAGWAAVDLARVPAYVAAASRALGVEIPANAPIVGRDVFRTATGVHAAALAKAARRGGAELADLVYSAVPASLLGRTQMIGVGPMSGAANVRTWLALAGHPGDEALVKRILAAAKRADRILSDDELHALARGNRGVGTTKKR